MAFISPSNKATGDVVTAAHWNQDIVANTQASVPDIFTTAGALAYATAADVAAQLAIGTARKVLEVNAGATAPTWGPVRPVSGQYMGAVAADRHLESGIVTATVAGASVTFTDAFSTVFITIGPTSGGQDFWVESVTGTGFTAKSSVGNAGLYWHAEGAD